MKATITFEMEVDDHERVQANTFIAIGAALHYTLIKDPEITMVVDRADKTPKGRAALVEFKGTYSNENSERGEMVKA